jgi:di/tricarboxylate transporter
VAVSPAVLALLAFLLAIALSMTTHVNVGLLGVVLAWLVGVYAGGMRVEALLQGFPSSLFITLLGVTLLFGVARANGTLEILTRRAARLVRGNVALLPLLFFVLAMLLSMSGPGAVASVALLAPLAMPTGIQAGVPNLLSAIMIGTGANAGNMSPVSAVGAMANELLARVGLPGNEWKLWATGFLAHLLVAAGAYVLFGGLSLIRARRTAVLEVEAAPFERRHWITVGVTMTWIAAVVFAGMHPGLSALAAGTLLILLRVAKEQDAIAGVPLDIILMVTGVTLLISVMEKTGGMDLGISRLPTGIHPSILNGAVALIVGIISTYSSTSGVVLPAFLPIVPRVVAQAGGGDPLAVALSISVGAALVDVSPLSTLGALCVAAVPDRDESRILFRQLLFWGFSMAVVGALICGLLMGAIARL